MSRKKFLIVLILKLLQSGSDPEHPLMQTKIAALLSEKYPCDRKTVGRNICFLQQIGYPIRKTAKGFYMEQKKFSVEEATYVLNAVRSCPIPYPDREALIEQLQAVLNRIYRSR